MKRHPEMQLIENLRVEKLVEEASHMYAKVSPSYVQHLFFNFQFSQFLDKIMAYFKKYAGPLKPIV